MFTLCYWVMVPGNAFRAVISTAGTLARTHNVQDLKYCFGISVGSLNSANLNAEFVTGGHHVYITISGLLDPTC